MKIKLDFDNKEIEVIGKVVVEELFKKVEELGLNTTEWNFVTKVEYITQSPLTITTTPYQPDPPYQPNKIWY